MVPVVQTRQEVRKAFRNKRLALNSEQQSLAAKALVEQFKTQGLFQGTKNIAIYLSFNGEIDTKPLIEYLWSQQAKVCLPVLHPFAKGHLLFQHFTPKTKMAVNRFGIMEPVLDARCVCPLNELDILFTPLVAFDLKGNRLGMGGGFYDRTLAFMGQNKQIKALKIVGLAHEIQLTPELPIESWDIPLPYVLTSNKLYSFV